MPPGEDQDHGAPQRQTLGDHGVRARQGGARCTSHMGQVFIRQAVHPDRWGRGVCLVRMVKSDLCTRDLGSNRDSGIYWGGTWNLAS